MHMIKVSFQGDQFKCQQSTLNTIRFICHEILDKTFLSVIFAPTYHDMKYIHAILLCKLKNQAVSMATITNFFL